jgi:cellulose synthase/poly-beta-1,6-N-acetylglucosamine synthase-like glycosyltransferase
MEMMVPMTDGESATTAVVIPLYNKAESVRRAIGSVLGQSLPPTEIIVVDDGSTDGSAEIVRQIDEARIRLICQPNGGVSAARNRGIAAARSRWIALLDADDEWMPGHLATMHNLRERYPSCRVLASGYVLRGGGRPDRSILLRGGVPEQAGVLFDYFDAASRSDPPLCSSAVVVAREALRAVGGFPVGVGQGEDLLTWARLAARYSIAYSREPTAAFWQPATDTGRPTRAPEPDDRVSRALRALLDDVPPVTRHSLTRYIALWHKMRGSMYLALQRRPLARFEFQQAIRLHPTSPALLAKYAMTLLPSWVSRDIMRRWTHFTRKPIGV